MSKRSSRPARLALATFAFLLMFALFANVAAAASTYFDQYPAVGGTCAEPMPRISVKVSDPAGISTGFQMKIDGVTKTPKTKWGPNNSYVELYFQTTSPLANGTHTVYASVFTGAGRTSTTWTFTQRVAPVIGPLSPADGSTVDTQKPTISAGVASSSAISSHSMTVDGLPVASTYNAATKTVSYTPFQRLANDADHEVALTVTDANGVSTSVSWSFHVQIYASMVDTQGCTECHATYPTAHPMDDCWGCHDGFAPFPAYWNMDNPQQYAHGSDYLVGIDCAYCHASQFPGVPRHPTNIGDVHQTSTDMSGCSCHVSDLTIEHNRYTTDSGEAITCASCHDSDDPQIQAGMAAGTKLCADCHTIGAGHPYGDVDHIADVGEIADLSGKTCGECHEMDLMPEHEKATSSSAGNGCANCHSFSDDSGPADTLGGWNQTCSQGVCHAAGSPSAMHAGQSEAHVPDGQSPSCAGAACHDFTDIAGLHSEATTSVAGFEYSSCTVCHRDGATLTKDCGTCHADRLAFHGYNQTMHTATLTSGGIDLFGNHDGWMGPVGVWMECDSCHSADLGPVHANLCSTCHPTPRDSFTAWSKNCTQGGCHSTYHASGFDHESVASGNCSTCHDEGMFDLYEDPCVDCHAHPDANDTTAPVTTPNVLTHYNGAAHISFGVTDSGKVAIGTTFRKLDGGDVTRGDFLQVTAGGEHSLEYWSVDQYGNEEAHRTVTFTVAPDTTAPVTTSNVKTAYEGPVSIVLSASDASTLGVKGTYYKLNGGATITGRTISIPQPASGTVGYTLEFWSDDYSGNVETHHVVSFTVTRDITPPVSTLGAQAFYKGPTVSIPFAAVDTGAGVSQKAYRVDGGTTQFLSAAATNLTRTFAAQGPHTIEYWSIDRVNNAEVHRTTTLVVDWTAPTVSSNALTEYPETGANITMTAVDQPTNGASPPNVAYRIDGGSVVTTGTPAMVSVGDEGPHSLEFWAVDLAGNASAHQIVSFTVGQGETPSGNGTLRLIWGEAGGPPPYSWAEWTVRGGSSTGAIVAAGSGDSGWDGAQWDGVDDVVVPCSVDPYWISIHWYDDWWPEYGDPTTIHFPVYVTTDGQVVDLHY